MTKKVLGNENLTLASVKSHLYVDINDDDALIQSYISASLLAVEKYIHNDILSCEYVSTASELENGVYYITNTPLRVEVDGVEITKDQYKHYEGRLYITDTSLEILINVKAFTGYTTIPENINLARKLLIGTWYDNREANILNSKSTTMPYGIDFILGQETFGAI